MGTRDEAVVDFHGDQVVSHQRLHEDLLDAGAGKARRARVGIGGDQPVDVHGQIAAGEADQEDNVVGVRPLDEDRVAAGAAVDRVEAAVADKRIVAGAAGHRVVARAADQGVVAGAADEGRVGGEVVVAGAAVEDDRGSVQGRGWIDLDVVVAFQPVNLERAGGRAHERHLTPAQDSAREGYVRVATACAHIDVVVRDRPVDLQRALQKRVNAPEVIPGTADLNEVDPQAGQILDGEITARPRAVADEDVLDSAAVSGGSAGTDEPQVVEEPADRVVARPVIEVEDVFVPFASVDEIVAA